MNSNADLSRMRQEIKLLTLDMSYRAGVGHVGSAMCIADILAVLYGAVLNIHSGNISDPDRDRFLLSKGHAVAALYATLYRVGILSKQDIDRFAGHDGGLCEHPEITDPGIEMSSGSLGHGLGFGVGISWGMKKRKSHARVVVLMSDGECGEGSVWEAAVLAGRLKLDNLTVVIDDNKWQCFGRSAQITPRVTSEELWKSFGWNTRTVDGHDIPRLVNALSRPAASVSKPTVVIAKTISGHGISLIENKLIGHFKVFTEDEYLRAREELSL